MRRWHEEYNLTKRNWKRHHQSHVEMNKMSTRNGVGKDPYEIDCICDQQVGRFRKMDGEDCGRPQCKVCHGDKFPKRQLTRHEKKSLLSLKEQKKEL